jgi:DNA polymerase theta
MASSMGWVLHLCQRIIYGIFYGMGPASLSENLECSTDKALEKIRSFESSFPGVSSWLCEAVAICWQKGYYFFLRNFKLIFFCVISKCQIRFLNRYVETLMCSKRFGRKINSGSGNEKAKAQRQAVNSMSGILMNFRLCWYFI